MLNATNIAKKILNMLLFTAAAIGADSNADNSVTMPKTPYLALYTTMPKVVKDDDSGAYQYTAGVEVQDNTEEANKTYRRVALYENGVSQKRIMGSAVIVGDSSILAADKAKDSAAGFPVGAARVANQDLIFYPEAEKEAYGNIVGFGVYDSLTGGTPYFWGTLSQDSGTNGVVTVNKNEIPIFRVGDLRICLA